MDFIPFLTGAVAAAIGGAVITGAFNVFIKKQEYKNTYLKMVLDKRVVAYEAINTLIGTLKISFLDDEDKQIYHNVFHDQTDFFELLAFFSKITEHELWMSDETRKRLHNLRKQIANCSHQLPARNLIEIGKESYRQIGILRDELEKSFIQDLLHLYKIDQFLKNKTVITEFISTDGYFQNKGSK